MICNFCLSVAAHVGEEVSVTVSWPKRPSPVVRFSVCEQPQVGKEISHCCDRFLAKADQRSGVFLCVCVCAVTMSWPKRSNPVVCFFVCECCDHVLAKEVHLSGVFLCVSAVRHLNGVFLCVCQQSITSVVCFFVCERCDHILAKEVHLSGVFLCV